SCLAGTKLITFSPIRKANDLFFRPNAWHLPVIIRFCFRFLEMDAANIIQYFRKNKFFHDIFSNIRQRVKLFGENVKQGMNVFL
ncbi:MAG: hypothetical protein IKH58_14865, partial [Bacteroidales bacterium]|nr:hypothetical protein [Bacteroidales bacterium]